MRFNPEIHEDCQDEMDEQASTALNDPMSVTYGVGGEAVSGLIENHLKNCDKCRELNGMTKKKGG